MSSLSASLPELTVAAGVLVDGIGRILITQRPSGAHMAGAWEFPGGKVGEAETLIAALVRELREELGIEVRYIRHLARFTHQYPDRTVHLHVWKVFAWECEVRGREGQPLRWISCDELESAGLLPADAPIISALRRNTAVNKLGWKSVAAAVAA